ncbi:eme-1, partial [Pristionchus pacificus]
NTSMADEVILLSDDEAPPTTVPSKVPKGSGIDRSTSSRASPIILGLSPLRSSSMRRDSTEVLTLSASPSLTPRARSTGAAAAAAAPPLRGALQTSSNVNIDDSFDNESMGGGGVRKWMPSVTKSSSEGGDGRKRKDKSETEQEKKRKQEERDQKKQERDERKATEANDKKRKAIEREISASKKSKAEEFLYLRVGREAMGLIPDFEAALLVLMSDRKIGAQLEKKDELEARVEWWRKSVEAIELEPGAGVERVESMIQEPVEVIVVDAVALAAIIKAADLEQHVIKLRSSLGVSNALLVLLANGKLNVKDSERDAQAAVLHERWKTQIREVHTANEAVLFLCQLHRATARLHMERAERIIVDVTKGQRDRVGLVADWWGKMLEMIPRVKGIYARALAAAFPNPLALMARIDCEGADTVERALAEVRTDIGKRIGNKRARKVIELLTTSDGMELFT